jgi:hypothetical protein
MTASRYQHGWLGIRLAHCVNDGAAGFRRRLTPLPQRVFVAFLNAESINTRYGTIAAVGRHRTTPAMETIATESAGNRFPSWIFLPVEEISANHQPSLQLIETKDF